MKDDERFYDDAMKDMERSYFTDKDGYEDRRYAALKELADRGNIHATFWLWKSMCPGLTVKRSGITEEKQVYQEKITKYYENEPEEFDGELMIRIGLEYGHLFLLNSKEEFQAESFRWYVRAYEIDYPAAGKMILHHFTCCPWYKVSDDDHYEWCIRILKDADFYIENDHHHYKNSSTNLKTVGDAVNGLVMLANKGFPKAQHTIGEMFLNGGFLGKDTDVGRKWIERSKL